MLIPAGAEAFAADVIFDRSVQLEDVERHAANGGRDFRGGAFADAAGIFFKGHVQDVMLAVLGRPVASDMTRDGADFRGVAA